MLRFYPYTWLVILGALCSVISAFGALVILQRIFFDNGYFSWERYRPTNIRFVAVLSTIAVMLFFVFPQPLLLALDKAAGVFF